MKNLLLLIAFGLTTSMSGQNYKYQNQWKMNFSNNQLAVDASGFVYVTGNGLMQKFNSSGAYVSQLSGNFGLIAIDASGNVYMNVANTIRKYTSSGTYIRQWGSNGNGNGQFDVLTGMAIDAFGNVYVFEKNNYRIQKFDSTGTYLTQWGTSGSGNGQFNTSWGGGIAIDASGNVYVADVGNNRIQKFSSTGTYITQWGNAGIGNGQFQALLGISLDGNGNVYVSDGDRIQIFNSAGAYSSQFSIVNYGDNNGQTPWCIIVDASANVYVSFYTDSLVQIFTPCQNININLTNKSVCSGDSFTFDAGAGKTSYSWSGPSGFTSDKRTVTVKTAGEYIVSIDSVKSCNIVMDSVLLSVNPSPVVATLINDSICAGNTKTFDAGAGKTAYYWTGPNGYLNNARTITVGNAGKYYVKVDSANGCSSKMDSVMLSIKSCPTGINEFVLSSTVSIFPNPSSENAILQISSNENTGAAILVYDLLGNWLMTKNTNLVIGSNQIPLSITNLSNGIYLMQINSNAGGSSMSFVVQK